MSFRRPASAALLLGSLPALAAAQTAPEDLSRLRRQHHRRGRGRSGADRAGLSAPPPVAPRGGRRERHGQNCGMSGEKTPTGSPASTRSLADGKPGDVLILMEGTNDINKAHLHRDHDLQSRRPWPASAEARGISAIHATVIPRPPDAKRRCRQPADRRSSTAASATSRGCAGGRRPIPTRSSATCRTSSAASTATRRTTTWGTPTPPATTSSRGSSTT